MKGNISLNNLVGNGCVCKTRVYKTMYNYILYLLILVMFQKKNEVSETFGFNKTKICIISQIHKN